MSGIPAVLNLPTVPPPRKDLRRQEKHCHFQPLRSAGTAGKYNAPGLPGITGDFYNLVTNNPKNIPQMGYAHGCFYTPAKRSDAGSIVGIETSASVTVADNGDGIQMDASRSNSHYGASSTVMPASADMTVALYLGRASEV